MYFSAAFGLCTGIKIQRMLKRLLSLLQTCSLLDFFIVCSKVKFCKLQGFLFSGEEKGRYVCDFLNIYEHCLPEEG